MDSLQMTRTQFRVSDFVSWQKNGTLELSPSFQRRPIWPSAAKSYLIDTIIRGLPIPIIFLRDRKSDLTSLEPRREVVDGQQRLRTLISYIAPMSLKDFKEERDAFLILDAHNRELGGKSFSHLSQDIQQRILDYQFSVHILPSGVDDREVLEIFARMNATGIRLNDQELRNAAYFGEFKTMAYRLAYEFLPQWRAWKVVSENDIARMNEVEITSEFIMVIMKGMSGKAQNAIDRIYEENDKEFAGKKMVEKRFHRVMEAIDDGIGTEMKSLPFHKKSLIYPLFAVVFHAIYGFSPEIGKKTKTVATGSFFNDLKAAGLKIAQKTAPRKVLELISRRTTHLQSRRQLVGFLLGECGIAKPSAEDW